MGKCCVSVLWALKPLPSGVWWGLPTHTPACMPTLLLNFTLWRFNVNFLWHLFLTSSVVCHGAIYNICPFAWAPKLGVLPFHMCHSCVPSEPCPHGCHAPHCPQYESHRHEHVEHVPTQWPDMYLVNHVLMVAFTCGWHDCRGSRKT